MRREKGFTLVELLVVVAIIAVLAGVVIVAINPAALLQKSRDTKRLQDLENVHKALSLAMAEGEITLPTSDTGDSDDTGAQAIDGTGWVAFTIPTGKTGLSKYIPTLPVDPTNTGTNLYYYGTNATATDYELNAVLESTDNAAKMSTDGGDDANRWEIGTSLTIISPAT